MYIKPEREIGIIFESYHADDSYEEFRFVYLPHTKESTRLVFADSASLYPIRSSGRVLRRRFVVLFSRDPVGGHQRNSG